MSGTDSNLLSPLSYCQKNVCFRSEVTSVKIFNLQHRNA